MAADVDVLWSTLTEALNPHSGIKLGEEQVLQTWESAEPWMRRRLHEWFLELLQADLRRVRVQFWSHFPSSSVRDKNGDKSWQSLLDAVEELFNQLVIYKPAVDLLKFFTALFPVRDVSQQFEDTCKAIIFTKVPKSFKIITEHFYSRSFKSYYKINSKARKKTATPERKTDDDDDDDDELDESIKCEACDQEAKGCSCEKILSQFALFNEQLRSLGLLHKVAGEAFVSVIHKEIKNQIEKNCKGEFESSFLGSLLEWLDNELCGWLQIVLENQGRESCQSKDKNLMETWKPKLQYFLYKSFAELRIEELFDIIVEFPESLPALNDLKECLEKTDLRSQLIKSLRSAFETRLLHPGANTSDILTQYISAIRGLRVLDTTGVILENVCDPVKQYLRTREDTVRCIVTSLTDENSTELAEELMHGNPLPIDEMDASDSEEEGEEWMPDPVDADPSKTSRSRRTPDIISMLVNIYGSKDLFVAEYRTLLADRILSVFNYDVDRELRYLELLKLRFGESHLHFCEIMLKDVADSRRINAHIHSSKNEVMSETNIDMNAMILSAVFWPSFKEEKLKVPDEVNQAMSDYTKGYEAFKGMRTLQWKPHLGLVELDIELEDRTLSLSVTPVQATAIIHFQEKERWTLEELSSTMHVPQGLLRKRLALWVNHGVLKEETADHYVVIERQKGARGGAQDVALYTEEESVMASSEDQREEELQVFWSYIIGMLTNLESLPLERIHSMLRMFAMQGPLSSQCSLEDVRRFLDRKVKDQELQLVNGLYRLPKPAR